jgi:hypothetical protein
MQHTERRCLPVLSRAIYRKIALSVNQFPYLRYFAAYVYHVIFVRYAQSGYIKSSGHKFVLLPLGILTHGLYLIICRCFCRGLTFIHRPILFISAYIIIAQKYELFKRNFQPAKNPTTGNHVAARITAIY